MVAGWRRRRRRLVNVAAHTLRGLPHGPSAELGRAGHWRGAEANRGRRASAGCLVGVWASSRVGRQGVGRRAVRKHGASLLAEPTTPPPCPWSVHCQIKLAPLHCPHAMAATLPATVTRACTAAVRRPRLPLNDTCAPLRRRPPPAPVLRAVTQPSPTIEHRASCTERPGPGTSPASRASHSHPRPPQAAPPRRHSSLCRLCLVAPSGGQWACLSEEVWGSD